MEYSRVAHAVRVSGPAADGRNSAEGWLLVADQVLLTLPLAPIKSAPRYLLRRLCWWGFHRAFLTVAFLLAGAAFWGFEASARCSAQRFLVAATIAALPAADSLRLGLDDSGVAGGSVSDSPRIFAHLAFCADAILRRAAAEILRFLVGASAVVPGSMGPPERIASALHAILSHSRVFSIT